MPTLPELISQYIAILKTEGFAAEAYKWELLEKQKGRPQLGAVDYGKEVRNLDYSNLIYGPTSLASLREIAEHEPEGLRAAHRKLFDETVDLNDRLAIYRQEANALFAKHRDDDRNAGQDERTAATILFFYDSSRYTLYKNSVYQKFCELLEVKSVSAGKKYAHYLDLLRVFAKERILNNNELQNTYRDLRSDIDELDPTRLLLSQDFLYRMLEQAPSSEIKSLKETGANRDDRIIGILRNKDVILQLHGDIPEGTNSIDVDYSVISEGNPSQRYFPIVKAEGRQSPTDWKDLNDGGGRHHFFACNGWKTLTITSQRNTDIMHSLSSEQKKAKFHPLNQILYGPPGTGKTYATRRMAVEICDGNAPEDRKDLKKRYKELVNENRIAFTTFHQSMSYEDFVEGIKPDLNVDDLSYRIEKGIFTQISEQANSRSHGNFEEAYNNFLTELTELGMLDLETSTKSSKFGVEVNSQKNLRLITYPSGTTSGTLTRARFEKQLQGINEDPAWSIYYWGVLYHLASNFGLDLSAYPQPEAPRGKPQSQIAAPASPVQSTWALGERGSAADRNDAKPHVLIIDEINRGNTPAIFGELITLLEEDKRLGNDEELTVTLPYSKEPFGVPNNLYVIGTMNTADRSVEALDAALRRRFEFKEVGPNPDVLLEHGQSDHGNILLDDGSKLHLPDFLRLLNQRITALRDRDHTIGHAPFFKVHDGLSLGRVLAKNVIPLLQEYFYGDDAQLARILGSGFVQQMEGQITFATSVEDDPDLPTRYTVRDPSTRDFPLADALRAGGFSVIPGV